MTTREIGNVLVDIIRYEYFGPDAASRDAVYNFTHSREGERHLREYVAAVHGDPGGESRS